MNNQTDISLKFTNKVSGEAKLEKYAATLQKVQTALGGIDSGKVNAINTSTKKTASATKTLASGSKSMLSFGTKAGLALGAATVAANAFYNGVRKVTTLVGKTTNASATYLENMNLLRVAYDDNTESAEKFVNKLGEMYGLDESWGYRTVGLFKQLSNAMGLTNEIGSQLSETMTQLSVDVASLYNINTDRAVSIFKSALAGQTKPVRELGGDITETTLNQFLNGKGIDKTVKQLTYAEKRLTIVASLLSQIEEASNDWGKTIESPANQTRILSEQWKKLTRVVGDIFLKAVSNLLPYLNAALMILIQIAKIIAKLVGYKASDFDYGGKATSDYADDMEDYADSLDQASKNAKKLKSGLRGFDKLNNISSPSSSSGSGSIGVGTGVSDDITNLFQSAVDEYNSKLTNVEMKATKIRDTIMQWLGFTKEINKETNEVSFKLNTSTERGRLLKESFENINDSIKNFRHTFEKVILDTEVIQNGFRYVESIMNTIATIFNLFSKKVKDLSLNPKFEKTLKVVLGYISDIYKILTNVVNWFTKEIMPVISPVSDNFINFLLDVIILLGNVYEAIKPILNVVLNILKPIVEALFTVIATGSTFIINTLDNLVNLLSDLFDNIVKPLFNFLSEKLAKYVVPYITVMYDIFKLWCELLKGFFNNTKDDWDSFIEALDKIKEKFEGIKNKFTEFKQSLIDGFGKLIDKVNTFINKIKNIIFPKVKLEVTYNTKASKAKLAIAKALGLDGWPELKFGTYAQGGMPPKGQLFIANEAGPELVGNIGGKSFVANQNQMLDLIDKKIGNSNNGTNKAVFNINVGNEKIATYVINNLNEMATTNGKPINIGG